MGIRFQSPLELSAHRAIAHSDSAQVIIVKVVTKTAAHPEYGNGSPNGYTIDGVEGAYIELTPGNTYKFDQADSSNNGHPLRFYEEADKTTAYTTGVTTNGEPGTSGAYTQIIPTTSTPPILFYQCSAHALMGSYVKFGTGTIGDTYSINATQDGDNVDIKLDAASGTDSTVQLTAGSNITLTRNDAQQVTIAASGGALTVQEEGSSLSTAATTLNFVGEGITASGTGATKTITVSGTSSGGQVTIEKNSFTATASQQNFTITSAPDSVNNLQIYLDGVYQAKSNYSFSGTTVTINSGTGVSVGTKVEIIHLKVTNARVELNSYTGNGSTLTFAVQSTVQNENNVQVYIDGVYQFKDTYSTSGTNLTFGSGNAPPSGSIVELIHIVPTNAENNLANYNVALINSNTNAQKDYLYIFTGNCTLTLPASPSNGDSVKISNRSGVATPTIARNGKNIMGAAADLTLDRLNAGFEMVFTGNAQGWVLIGVEGTAA